MSTSTTSVREAAPARPRRSSQQRWLTRLVVAVVVLVMGGPMALQFARTQLSQWLSAVSSVSARQDIRTALVWADRAIAVAPGSADPYLRRATLHLAAGDFEASLADCNQAISLDDTQVVGFLERMMVHQRMGLHQQAVDDCSQAIERIRARLEDTSPMGLVAARPRHELLVELSHYLNARAYASALGRLRLQDALQDIQNAFKLREEARASGARRFQLPEQWMYRDTRGYIHLLLGQLEPRIDMEAAVEMAEDYFEVTSNGIELQKQNMVDAREALGLEVMLKHQLAILYYHRGQVHLAERRQRKGQRDIQQALLYGYNPEQGVW